ncbi:MAG: hypothetical protein RLZZ387_3949 [Chloroflexota bacterium]|jgi:hypothetical protein
MTPRLNIAIDSLALHGAAAFDADAFAASLGGELARLLADSPVPGRAVALEELRVELPGALDSAALGVAVAHALFAQLRGGAP